MGLGRSVHTGTATSRSNGLLQLPSFSYVVMLASTDAKHSRESVDVNIQLLYVDNSTLTYVRDLKALMHSLFT